MAPRVSPEQTRFKPAFKCIILESDLEIVWMQIQRQVWDQTRDGLRHKTHVRDNFM